MLWSKKSRSSDLGPQDQEPLSADVPAHQPRQQDWQVLGVPAQEALALSKARGVKLTPAELARITRDINKLLVREGFEIQVTFHQALGAMVDQLNYFNLRREELPLSYIAVWKYVDQQFRQEWKLDPHVEFGPKQQQQVRERVQALIKQAADKKSLQRQERLTEVSSGQSYGIGRQPIACKTVEELIIWEACVQARRKHKLKSDDPIPPEIMEEEKKRAWESYQALRGGGQKKI